MKFFSLTYEVFLINVLKKSSKYELFFQGMKCFGEGVFFQEVFLTRRSFFHQQRKPNKYLFFIFQFVYYVNCFSNKRFS